MKTHRISSSLLWALLSLSSLVFHANGFYDPNLGRWINRDPIGAQVPQDNQFWGNILLVELEQGANLYWAFHNDPISHYDGDGRLFWGCKKETPPVSPYDYCWKDAAKNKPKTRGMTKSAWCKTIYDACQRCCINDFFLFKEDNDAFDKCIANCTALYATCLLK